MQGIAASTTQQLPRGAAARLGRTVTRGLARVIAAAAEGLSRRAINRRVVFQLSGMSDRELRDIGLVRQDVLDAVALPPVEDSTSFLLERRRERRGGVPSRAA